MRFLTLVILTMLSAAAYAGDSYLCVAGNAMGFKFNERTMLWEAAAFAADQYKYIVRPLAMNSERYTIGYRNVVQETDTGTEIALCRQGSDVYGSLNCGEPRDPYKFSIRKETMRFIMTFSGSFLTSTREIFVEDAKVTVKKVPDKGGESPIIAIGSCSPI